jgi:NADH-quinone oxidoreductase subunit C
MTGAASGTATSGSGAGFPPVGGGTPLGAPQVLERLTGRFGDRVRAVSTPPGKSSFALVERGSLIQVMAFLRDEPALRFDLLADVTVVDHLLLELPEITERFVVVYQLSSLFHGHRFQVKTAVPEDDPRVPSLSDLWRSAAWGEREAHDMFGVEFQGNPDLRRLLMPENYPGFPLRKDYPLKGRGERDSFPQHRPAGAPAEGRRRELPAV